MPVGRRGLFRGIRVRVQSRWKEMIALAQCAVFARVASNGAVLSATRSGFRLPLNLWRGLKTVRKFIVADIRFSPDRGARGGIAHSAAGVPFQLSRSHTGSALVYPRLQ
jgi:hypothetical protein